MHYDGGPFFFSEWSRAFHWSFNASRCVEDPEEKEVNLVTLLLSNFFTSSEEANIRVGFHLQSILIHPANIY